MTAKEFFEFKQKPENSERKFVQVEDKNLSSKYSVIFIEANKELYKKCNAEHSEDMRRKEEKKKYPRGFVSLDKLRGDDSDTDNRWEEEYILDKLQAEELHKAIEQLTEKEKRTFEVIAFAVLQVISERELAVSLGIPQKTLNNRKRKIIVLHFLCGMELSEIAYLLETDLNSIYVQKCTAIKHLKKILM